MESTQVNYLCECFIDQNRFIGTDPIGHRCMNNAKYIAMGGQFFPKTLLYCEPCRLLSETNPERLSFPPHGCYGAEYQKQVIEAAAKLLLVKGKEDEKPTT